MPESSGPSVPPESGRVLTGWEREWAYVQERAGAPRGARLGCSTISHVRLGFCSFCVRTLRDGGPNGVDLELGGWRLLALRKEAEDV